MDATTETTTAPTAPTTYSVAAERLPALRERFERLARRAAKLHLPAPRLIEDGTEVERLACWYDSAFREHAEPCASDADVEAHRALGHRILTRVRHLLHVEGTAPVFDGWSFGASLQHLRGAEGEHVVLFRARGDLPEGVRERYAHANPANCDHCHKAIARKATFLLLHEDGRTVQIGRSCLQDFLPHVNVDRLVWAATLDLDAEDVAREASMDDGWLSRPASWGVEDFLAQVAAVIRLDGWASKASVEGTTRMSTVMTVENILISPKPPTEEWRKQAVIYAPTDADRQLTADTIAWATTTLPAQEKISDYEYNLSVLCRQVVVPERGTGLLASAVAAYQRHLGREIERRTAAAASHHVGTVSEKLTISATLQAVVTLDGDYGTTWLHRFVADDGAVLVWFASNGEIVGDPYEAPCNATAATGETDGLGYAKYAHPAKGCKQCRDIGKYTAYKMRSIEIGETVTLRGTVKRHDVRQGVPQTILTRCSVPTAEALELEAAKAERKAAKAAKKAAKETR